MAGYDSVENVRALTHNDVNKLTNAQLKKALVTILTAEREREEEPSDNDLLNELKVIKENIQEINKIKEEVKCLTEKLESTFQIIHQQQLYLEAQDNKERRCNLGISGLSETADSVGADDKEKLKTILTKAKCPSEIDPSAFILRCLGQPNANYGRYFHVICENHQQREAIIATAKELMNAGPTYSCVYIKKDIHPVVRK